MSESDSLGSEEEEPNVGVRTRQRLRASSRSSSRSGAQAPKSHRRREHLDTAQKKSLFMEKERQRDKDRGHNLYKAVASLTSEELKQRRKHEREKKRRQKEKKLAAQQSSTDDVSELSATLSPSGSSLSVCLEQAPESTAGTSNLPKKKRPDTAVRWQRKRWMEAAAAEASLRFSEQLEKARKANRLLRQRLSRLNASSSAEATPTTISPAPNTSAIAEPIGSSTPISEVTPRKRTQDLLTQCGITTPQPALEKTLQTQFAISQGVREMASKSQSTMQTAISVAVGKGTAERNLVKGVSAELQVNWRTVKKYSELDHTPPTEKPRGVAISEETRELVKQFYLRQDNSSECPGIKDTITVKGVKYQKHLLRDYMKILFAKFQSEYPDVNLGYTSFTMMRPAFVLPPKESDHQTCMCQYHENVRLKIEALNGIGALETKESAEVVKKILCSNPTDACWLRECPECKHSQILQCLIPEELADTIDLERVLTWKEWRQLAASKLDDRRERQVISGTLERLFNDLGEELQAFSRHHFITIRQFQSIQLMRKDSPKGTLIVQMDFAENYTCSLNKEIQSYYFAQSAVTIHPMMLWFYSDSDSKSTVKKPLIIVSDTKHHTTSSVYAFQCEMFKYINSEKPFGDDATVKRVVYLTDGSAAQYKNKKNFSNLANHKQDFDCPAEWHFFTTPHGKGACDGLGAAIKRTARDLVTKNICDITSSTSFFNAVCEVTNMKVILCNQAKIDTYTSMLEQRWSTVSTMAGTQSYHSFKPVSTTTLHAWNMSCGCLVCISGGTCEQRMEDATTHFLGLGIDEPETTAIAAVEKNLQIGKQVVAVYTDDDGPKMYVGEIIPATDTTDTASEVRIQYMPWSTVSGPPNLQKKKLISDQVDVLKENVLMNVIICMSATGRTTFISAAEYSSAQALFKVWAERQQGLGT